MAHPPNFSPDRSSPHFAVVEEKARIITTSRVQTSAIEKVETKAITTETMERIDDDVPRSPVEPLRRDGASFKHLFLFATRRERVLLAPAILTSALLAGTKIIYAVILGLIFETVSQLGSFTITADDALTQVSVYCIILTGLGAFKAVISALFMSAWIAHGESRAQTIRTSLLKCLFTKPLSWFDARHNGAASLTTELQS